MDILWGELHITMTAINKSRKATFCALLACVAAGPRTRLNHLYTEGLERLRSRQARSRPAIEKPTPEHKVWYLANYLREK